MDNKAQDPKENEEKYVRNPSDNIKQQATNPELSKQLYYCFGGRVHYLHECPII